MIGQISINMTDEDIKLIAAEVVRQLSAAVPTKVVEREPVYVIKQLLTDKDVADMLSISKGTVWNYEKSGVIPKPYKLAGSTRWKLSEIMQTIDNLQLSLPMDEIESTSPR